MMNRKLTALALAGALSLTLLAGCGPKEPAPTATPTPEATATVTPTVEPTAEPTEKPIDEPIAVEPTEPPALTATPTAEPTKTPAPTKAPATPKPTKIPAPTKAPATPKPTEKPVATPKPTEQPVATPVPTPTPAALTAAGIYKSVSSIGGAALSDTSFVLDQFYNLSTSDLEDYILYMPDMSTSLTEVFIAKVKDGKMDTIKSACQSRQQGLAEDAEFYPDTGAYVDSYQLVTNGNWILFAVCEGADAVASTFNSLTK